MEELEELVLFMTGGVGALVVGGALVYGIGHGYALGKTCHEKYVRKEETRFGELYQRNFKRYFENSAEK